MTGNVDGWNELPGPRHQPQHQDHNLQELARNQDLSGSLASEAVDVFLVTLKRKMVTTSSHASKTRIFEKKI